MPPRPRKFLTAQWRDLLMLNFPIDPDLLRPHMPQGVEVDCWNGRAFVSIVGFRFVDARLLGVPLPFHRNFDEINLRFYVRRRAGDEWRRGVVFIKEIVPLWMVSCVARNVYNENYVTRRMRSLVELPKPNSTGRVHYEWKDAGRWHVFGATTEGEPQFFGSDSEESFITEHYWGYTRQRDGGTIEYEVEHPPWRLWHAKSMQLDFDLKAVYPSEFAETLGGKPSSAFVAEGSAIVVRQGQRVP